MALANYADLVSSISSYLFGRTDLAANIPDFVTLCEAQLNRRLRVRQMEGRYTASLTAGNAYLATPSGMISFRRLAVTSINPTQLLSYVTPDEMYVLWNDTQDQDTPINYTVIGSEIQFGPIPDQAYTIEGDYYAQIPGLQANSTNWLMSAFPDIYLFGTLKQAAPFLGNDSRLPIWNAALEQSLTELELNDNKDRYAMSSLTARVDFFTP